MNKGNSEGKSQVEEFQWLENSPAAVFVYEAEGEENIIYANQKLLTFFECGSFDEFVEAKGGRTFRHLVYQEDYQRTMAELNEQLRDNYHGFDRLDFRIETKSGRLFYVEDFGYRIEHPKYGPLFYVQIVDASKQRAKFAVDELTGLPRMQRFLQYIDRERLLGEKEEAPGAEYRIIYFNICNFKMYNITFGKPEGDQVLINLGSLLKRVFVDDYISRFSGDHFTVFTKSDHALDLIQRVHGEFEKEYARYNLKLKAGVYALKQDQNSALVLCDLAKAACDSIRSTNDYIKVYGSGLEERLEISSYVVNHLDEALEHKYIKVYYQPVVRTINSQLCGMEALARWDDPKYGLLSPYYFIGALEESRQINKLDLYVIRETCRQIRICMDEGRDIVPISFNLSRLDFALCDIFEQIEEITKEYAVPRNMINVEITESMVIDNPGLIKREICRFRRGGYQVWMDDFGSGYSSLNILKDYRMDEIKLDMEFLSSFTETSQNIITSVVDMAKRIGIRTLAEGVETEEQVEFLKNIGCEKVQGFFYGRPMPFEALMEHCQEHGLEVEKCGWRPYYERIGNVNFVTDKPLCIMEDNGERIHYIYLNQKFMEEVQSTGLLNAEQMEEVSNSKKSPLARLYRSYLNKDRPNGEMRTIEFTINGRYMRVFSEKLAATGSKACFRLELNNITKTQDEQYRDQHDHIYRTFYQMYDAVYLLHLDKNYFDPVLNQKYKDEAPGYYQNKEAMKKAFFDRILPEIFVQDRELFLQFFDFEKVDETITQSGKGFASNYFRTRNQDGSYTWKIHSIMKLPGQSAACYLYIVGYTPLADKDVVIRLANLQGLMENGADWKASLLFWHLVDTMGIKLFWKDKERRFLGASRSFLDYYGMKNVEEVLGKTDEDMGWHIINEPFSTDEYEVLNEGKQIVNAQGTNIVNGVVHHILASKVPVYENGKITGLLGYFHDVGNMRSMLGNYQNFGVLDPVSGLMNVYGVIGAIAELTELERTGKGEFALIHICTGCFEEILRNFGKDAEQPLLQAIGKCIIDTIEAGVIGGRVHADHFILCVRYEKKSRVERISESLRENLKRGNELFHGLGELVPSVEIFYPSYNMSLLDIMNNIVRSRK